MLLEKMIVAPATEILVAFNVTQMFISVFKKPVTDLYPKTDESYSNNIEYSRAISHDTADNPRGFIKHKIFYMFLVPPLHPVHFILLDFFTPTIAGGEYKLGSS
jgi:hypothetical protein